LKLASFALAAASVALLGPGCTDQGSQSFRTITSDQQGTLLSAWVASDGTAYFAGGVVGGGAGAGLILRWDGQTVNTIPTPDAHAFWWIHGVSDNEMYLAGEGGEVHAFDGTTLTRIDAGAPADAILYGVWGASGSDLWAVGGSFLTGGPRQVIVRGSGAAWQAVPSPPDVDPDVTYFKVWGASASDVWIVGDQGVVLRSVDGGALVRADAPGAERYTTVHGCAANDVYAVGGGGSGAAIHYDGTAWSAFALAPEVPALAGVACANGAAYVGGFDAYAALLRGGTPLAIPLPVELQGLTIHGLGIGGKRVVAVGGDFGAPPTGSQRGFAVDLRR